MSTITASAGTGDESSDETEAQLARDAANIAAQLAGGDPNTVPDLTAQTPLTERIGDAIDSTMSDAKNALPSSGQVNFWFIAIAVILVLAIVLLHSV